jgi:hypothetical protein
MNGYCGDCDKQIELTSRNIEQERIGTTVYIYLVCPWCEEKELITDVDCE